MRETARHTDRDRQIDREKDKNVTEIKEAVRGIGLGLDYLQFIWQYIMKVFFISPFSYLHCTLIVHIGL